MPFFRAASKVVGRQSRDEAPRSCVPTILGVRDTRLELTTRSGFAAASASCVLHAPTIR